MPREIEEDARLMILQLLVTGEGVEPWDGREPLAGMSGAAAKRYMAEVEEVGDLSLSTVTKEAYAAGIDLKPTGRPTGTQSSPYRERARELRASTIDGKPMSLRKIAEQIQNEVRASGGDPKFTITGEAVRQLLDDK